METNNDLKSKIDCYNCGGPGAVNVISVPTSEGKRVHELGCDKCYPNIPLTKEELDKCTFSSEHLETSERVKKYYS